MFAHALRLHPDRAGAEAGQRPDLHADRPAHRFRAAVATPFRAPRPRRLSLPQLRRAKSASSKSHARLRTTPGRRTLGRSPSRCSVILPPPCRDRLAGRRRCRAAEPAAADPAVPRRGAALDRARAVATAPAARQGRPSQCPYRHRRTRLPHPPPQPRLYWQRRRLPQGPRPSASSATSRSRFASPTGPPFPNPTGRSSGSGATPPGRRNSAPRWSSKILQPDGTATIHLRIRPDRIERTRPGRCSERHRNCSGRRIKVSEFGWQPVRVPPALRRSRRPPHDAAGPELSGHFQKDAVSLAQPALYTFLRGLRDRRAATVVGFACWATLRCVVVGLAFLLAAPGNAAVSWSRLTEPWPEGGSFREMQGIAVSWPSSSPFTPEHIGAGPEDNPPTQALGRLYLPPGNHAPRSVPAVVLLHGSGGVLPMRELTYARATRGDGGCGSRCRFVFCAARPRHGIPGTSTEHHRDDDAGRRLFRAGFSRHPAGNRSRSRRADRVLLRSHGDDIRALRTDRRPSSRRAGRASPATSRSTDPASPVSRTAARQARRS